MDIAIYGRVSTKDKGQDAENQLIQLRQFASKWGTLACEYVDQASASGKVIRSEFTRMLDDARMRKFDLILFWSLDRFSREGVLETLTYLKSLNDWGVNWKSYTEQYLDSTGIFKEAIIGIIAAIAKQERIRISERVKAGMDRAKEQGKEFGRPKKIFRRDLAIEMREQGKSVREIAKELGIARSTVHTGLSGVPKPSPLPLPLGELALDSSPIHEHI